jgi:endo-alpha-1,4-polygalactosaminidase (GH114 family)
MTSKPKSSKSPPSQNGAKRKRTNYADIKVGDRLSETQYYKVISITNDTDRLRVQNERGFEFSVSKEIVEEGMYNASQYTEEKKVSRTALVNILEGAGDTIFTVNFHKKPNEETVLKALKTCTVGDLNNDAKMKELSVILTSGEERTLVGYLLHTEPKMGRSRVVDLTKPANQNNRLVDHRTMNWMIYKGTKYTAN